MIVHNDNHSSQFLSKGEKVKICSDMFVFVRKKYFYLRHYHFQKKIAILTLYFPNYENYNQRFEIALKIKKNI